jgi:hypothetical protein
MYHFKHCVARLECLLVWQPKLAGTKAFSTFQTVLQTARLATAMGLSDMELYPIFMPVHQVHQQLVGSAQVRRSAKVSQAFFNHLEHQFEDFA